MLKSYLKIALRNLFRHKVYSVINVFGLAVGLACFLVISVFILYELSYDRHHANADRIYRVTRDWVNSEGKVSLHLGHVAPPFGPLLQNEFPDVEEVVRLISTSFIMQHEEKVFNEEEIYIAEKNVFRVFTLPLQAGNPATALAEPNTIVLTAEMGRKFFGNEDPIGKVLRVGNAFDLQVTGVMEPLPPNSHFHPRALVSFSTLHNDDIYGLEQLRANFGNNSFGTYLLLPPNYPTEQITAQFPAFIDKVMGPNNSQNTRLYLQKLTDIHLHSHLDSEFEANGDIKTVYIFSAVALFILLIACINFMNLSTARSANRAKEVGVRKVIGANRPALIRQFLAESVLLTLLALAFALLLVEAVLPSFSRFTGRDLSFDLAYTWPGLPLILLFAVGVGVLAGSYPAFFLSSFEPVKVLKGKLASASGGRLFRQVLVTVQFAVSIMLLISTAVVFQQLRYIQGKSLGFNKDQVLILPLYPEGQAQFETLKQELKRPGVVREVGASSRVPSGRLLDSNQARVLKGDSLAPTTAAIKDLRVDHDFIPAYEMELVAGRNFSRAFGTDDSTAFILNEAALRAIGWNSPQEAVGQLFGYGQRQGQVIGVVRDFHFESLHQEVSPLVLYLNNPNYNSLSVSVRAGEIPAALAHLEQTWNTFLPNWPFEYEFLDERFGALYAEEQKLGQLFTVFSGLAILIACLGLFGLASFTVTQRTKEIGIRKVLGASLGSLFYLLSREFVLLVLLSTLLAWPVAWYFMRDWLQDFAYRVDMPYTMFGVATFLALLIALLTVGYQAVKASLANPVKSLRSE
ncbi:ABC transporter permease [soil metagenome]